MQESRATLRRCQDAHHPWATVPLHSFPSPCSDLLSLRNESTGWGSIWHLEGLPEDPQGGGGLKDEKRNGAGLTSRKPGWGPRQPSQAGREGLSAQSWGTFFHQGAGLSQECWRCVWHSLCPNLSRTYPRQPLPPLRGFEGQLGVSHSFTVNRLREARRPKGWCRNPRAGAEPLPLPHQTVLILQRERPPGRLCREMKHCLTPRRNRKKRKTPLSCSWA